MPVSRNTTLIEWFYCNNFYWVCNNCTNEEETFINLNIDWIPLISEIPMRSSNLPNPRLILSEIWFLSGGAILLSTPIPAEIPANSSLLFTRNRNTSVKRISWTISHEHVETMTTSVTWNRGLPGPKGRPETKATDRKETRSRRPVRTWRICPRAREYSAIRGSEQRGWRHLGNSNATWRLIPPQFLPASKWRRAYTYNTVQYGLDSIGYFMEQHVSVSDRCAKNG